MAKKTFKENPALQFISAPSEEPEIRPITPPEGFKRNPEYVEVKTRRVQLVLQPSLYARVKQKAKQSDLSVNEFISQVLDKETREES